MFFVHFFLFCDFNYFIFFLVVISFENLNLYFCICMHFKLNKFYGSCTKSFN